MDDRSKGDGIVSAAKKLRSKRKAKRSGVKVLRSARRRNSHPRKDGKVAP